MMQNHHDFIPKLTFVLELDGKIVGNIMYTKAWLDDGNDNRKEILSFGPLFITPEYQRRKLSKILIEHSFEVARKMDYNVNIIPGSPNNYVSRGFVSCKKKNVSFIVDGNFPTALLIAELVPNALDGRKQMIFQATPPITVRTPPQLKPSTPLSHKKKWMTSQEEFYIYSHSSVIR